MKLEVGMYVRFKYGIVRYFNDPQIAFAISALVERYEKVSDTLKIEDYIVKASHNIIDLIEVGDYVNGIRVGYINKGEDYLYALTDENTRDVICGYDGDEFTKPLHSIVTKEQFEQMEYKVGE